MVDLSPRPLALLAGGGTGGHVFPALAVAEGLVARGWQVRLVGSDRGLEARLAAERGVPFTALAARPVVGRGPVAKALALGTIARSALAARGLIRRENARVVLGTGGYASAPAALGGWLAGRPVLLLEPNAEAGAANRWLSRLAAEALTALPGTERGLSCPATVTGVPVRRAFFEVPAVPAERPGVSILVLGGSQGAQQLNRELPGAVARLAARHADLHVVHQSGRAHEEATLAAYREAGLTEPTVTVVPFIDDVAGAMAAADLIVSRAGALTVAEIAAAGRPAVFVPLALAGGHQIANARRLADAGAARLVPPEEVGAERLHAALAELAGDRPRLVAMGAAARGLARPGAVEAIVDRLLERAGEAPR
ncbi:MAG TPA: undecaprenyldiphospho-muramoylpentapeptide beta-N-acetylglucosaminyltransferase [Thermoanaerobaculia bacterium]|nr:undecaprenyldiphospho-muramoylpentapeptide beta-N-acetylglucosaminyltransferase [Thermoanaerobaculia bacterium]